MAKHNARDQRANAAAYEALKQKKIQEAARALAASSRDNQDAVVSRLRRAARIAGK